MDSRMDPTTVLVLGATGATGRLLVAELLGRGLRVRAVVRDRSRLPRELLAEPRLAIREASLLDLEGAELEDLVRGCDAVASCLGHNLTLKGVFGPPRRLVTDAVRRVHRAIRTVRPERPVRMVLMGSAGCGNRDLDERVSFAQRCVIGALRVLVPPHADNEDAAEFLRAEVGAGDPCMEWVAVRPDGLTDGDSATGYEVHPSPTRSAIFDAGTTSRGHVAHFMADLAAGGELWDRWRGRMPVIYDRPPTADGGAAPVPGR